MALRLVSADRRPFYAKATDGVWDTSTVPSWATASHGGVNLQITAPCVVMSMPGQTFHGFIGSENFTGQTMRYFQTVSLHGPGSNEVLVIPV